jgi:hypothetical protein
MLHLTIATLSLLLIGAQQDPRVVGRDAELIVRPDCADSLVDQADLQSCVQAATLPTLGMLYPLSQDLFVDPGGYVGIGTTSPDSKLHVISDGASFTSVVRAETSSAGFGFNSVMSNPDGIAVRGALDTLTGNGIGISGVGPGTPAGIFPGTAVSGTSGVSAAFAGVVGATNPYPAVYGVSLADAGIGVEGVHDSLFGPDAGVAGTTRSEDEAATGVYGLVFATNPGSSAAGVRGSIFAGVGGAGVYGEHNGVGVGVYGYVPDVGIGVSGVSEGAGLGIYGLGTNGTGVHGETSSPSGYGVFSTGDFGGTGAKYFVQPHPTDASKEVRFVCLEGNEAGTYFRGSSRLVKGSATIEVPEEFRLVTELEGLTVQVTALGEALVWVELKSLERIEVRGRPDVEFDYFVNGVRLGFADLEPVQANGSFIPRYRDEPYAMQLPRGVRDLLVENGILNADFTPNETTAARMGWELRDPATKLAPKPGRELRLPEQPRVIRLDR